MDDTLIWCALIGAVAYAIKPMLPTYYELTKVSQHRLDAINDAVDDNEQTMLAIGSANEKMQRRLEVLESDVGGHLTRLDDLEGNAIVGLRAVNILDESNVAIRHAFQMLVGENWIDVPVENVWEKADD